MTKSIAKLGTRLVLHCEQVDEMGGAYGTCWTEKKYIHRF